MNTLTVAFTWLPVMAADDVVYTYPAAPTEYIRARYNKPGVYRWTISKCGSLRAVYVGEAEYVSRRLRQYLKPANNQTNRAVKTALDEARSQGLEVHFEVLSFEPFEFNGVEFSATLLSSPFQRRALENLALIPFASGNCVILNRSKDLVLKLLTLISKENPNFKFNSLPQASQAEFVQKLKTRSASATSSS